MKNFKFDIVLMDRENKFKRVIVGGVGTKPNMFIWKNLSPDLKDIDIEKYMSMRKFLRECYLDVTPDFKARLFSNIVMYIRPRNTYTVWCDDKSKL